MSKAITRVTTGDPMVTIDEVAALLRCSAKTIRRYTYEKLSG